MLVWKLHIETSTKNKNKTAAQTNDMAEVDYENTDLTEVDSVPRYGWLVHAASIMNASSTFIAFSSRHECSLPTRTTVSLGGITDIEYIIQCAPNSNYTQSGPC